jgi:hypothetical protein
MRPVKHQGSDTFLLAALWNVPLAIDINAHASRKSSIFLGRIVGAMFMRVNAKCAHHWAGQRSPAVGQTSLVRAQDFHRVEPQGAVRRYQAGHQGNKGEHGRHGSKRQGI